MVAVRFNLIILILRITSDKKMWLKTFIILTLDIKKIQIVSPNCKHVCRIKQKNTLNICFSAITKIQRNDHRTVKPISSVMFLNYKSLKS